MINEYNIEHYVSMQKQELEEHRWYMGEKLNRPINDYELIQDWIISGHAERFKIAYLSHLQVIEEKLKNIRPDEITKSLVHILLED